MINVAQIWFLAILLVFSGFFSGVEAAFLALTSVDVRQMIEKKVKGAKLVQKLKSDPHRLVITILIGNNLVNIAASSIAASMAMQIFKSNAIGISTGIMTLVVLIFGEITPKTLAIGHKRLVCSLSALPIQVLMWILYPLIVVMDGFTTLMSKVFHAKTEEKITEEEIKSMITLGEESGSIEKQERWMINNIFKFNDIEVSEIMTPRTDIFYVNESDKISDVTKLIIDSGKSRIPVFAKDKMVGIVYVKDIFREMNNNKNGTKIKDIMHSPYFVPEQKKIDDLLMDFRKMKIHIAVVVDEYGNVVGIVTIEDILEEIVGEIYDETDERDEPIKKIDKKNFVVHGLVRTEQVNEVCGIKAKVSDEYDTISGFILNEIGRIPNKGERFDFKKFIIVVEKADRTRIDTVRIIKK